METLLHNLSEVFAVSIIHSLWQCLLIYLVLRIVLADIVRLSPAAKYHITVTALFAATAWFVYTLFDQAANYSWQIASQTANAIPQHLPLIADWKAMSHLDEQYEIALERYLPYITIAYITGLAFHSLRLLSAWFQIRQVKQGATNDYFLQNKVNQLTNSIGIKRKVTIGMAEKIDIPCIAGYLKPVILLPLSLATYLSPKEIEAILLHELAHVKRNDYLVNLMQHIMSVVLFFNPFVLLMNRMINEERENSCDDMVVALSGQPLTYAQALLKIEQNNVRQLPLALAATGNKYQLLNRIERIMKTKKPMANVRHVVLAFTILLGSISSIAWLNPAISNGKLSVKPTKFSGMINITNTEDTVAIKADKKPKTAKSKSPQQSNRMVYSKNGKTYYYTSGMADPKLEAMGKEMENYGKQLEAYYNAPEFKKLQENMEQKGRDIGAFYDNPELKKLQADQEKVSKEFEAAYGDNSGAEKLGKKMEAVGKKMETYYNSDAFKNMNAKLMKKYGIPENYNYTSSGYKHDDNYNRYQSELNKSIPVEVSDLGEEMRKLGDEMKNQFNTPERKAKTAQLRAVSDSMRHAFQNPQIKLQQEQMRTMGDAMRNYTANPDIKRLQQQMKELGEKMREYTNSPEFQKRMDEWRKNMKAANKDFNFNFNVDAPEPPAATPAPPTGIPEPPAVSAVSPASPPSPVKP